MTLIKYDKDTWNTMLMLKGLTKDTKSKKTLNKYNRLYKKTLKEYSKAS